MALTDLLARRHGTERVLYLAVDGYEPYLMVQHGHSNPSWSRSIKNCLFPPTEVSTGLDLGAFQMSWSGMTFHLNDIEEDDRTSHFGGLFSTGRWVSNPHVRVQDGANYHEYVAANAVEIPIKTNAAMPSSGAAFIGGEAINYGSQNATTLRNVSKGLYSCVNNSQPWGLTYPRPKSAAYGYNQAVGTVPFTFIGRRVALYLTAFDRSSGDFAPESESQLLWCGRITDQISQDGLTGQWKLSCESLMEELDQDVLTSQATTYLTGVEVPSMNMVIHEHDSSGAWVGYYRVEWPTGPYASKWYYAAVGDAAAAQGKWGKQHTDVSNHTLLQSLSYALNTAPFTTTGGGGTSPFFRFLSDSTGKVKLQIYAQHVSLFRIEASPPDWGSQKPWIDNHFNHAWYAAGMWGAGLQEILVSGNTVQIAGGSWHSGSHEGGMPFQSYFALQGGGQFVTPRYGNHEFVEDQGDYGTQRAYGLIEEVTIDPESKTEKTGPFAFSYTDKTTTHTWEDQYGVSHNHEGFVYKPVIQVQNEAAFAGNRMGDDRVEVKQIWMPPYKHSDGQVRGPFEMLLYPLLSTGTTGYNHAIYDKLPYSMALGIQAELVDKESFRQADKWALATDLGHRRAWYVDEPTSWLALLTEECKLHGYSLVWSRGRLRLKAVLHSPEMDAWTVALNDSTGVNPDEFPSPTKSTSVIINKYECKIIYNPITGKTGVPITITDVDSVTGTGTAKKIKITHNGIWKATAKSPQLTALLKSALLSRWIRYPQDVIEVSLNPTLVNRIAIGDVVKYESNRMMDPYGSGTRRTSVLATVIDVKWDYKKWTGAAKLILHDRPLGATWAPAAAANVWYPDSQNLQVAAHQWSNSDHPDDGNAVAEYAGWEVVIHDRAPLDPRTPQSWGPYTVLDYSSSNHMIQLEAAANLSGFTNGAEYVVTFADWSDINTEQFRLDKGVWQADPDSRLLGAANYAQRYT